MASLALRHWTAILIAVAIAAWAVFYVPQTPSWMILRLKQAIDARDGAGAARYVDFQSVVQQCRVGNGGGPERLKRGYQQLSGCIGREGCRLSCFLVQWPRCSSRGQFSKSITARNKYRFLPQRRPRRSCYSIETATPPIRAGLTTRVKFGKCRLAREEGGWKIVEVKNVEAIARKAATTAGKSDSTNRRQPNRMPPDTGAGAPLLQVLALTPDQLAD